MSSMLISLALPFSMALLAPSRASVSIRLSAPIAMVATTKMAPPTAEKTRADWLDLWFPVCFDADVEDDQIVPATVFERPLVLYRDETGVVRCLKDECPHRLAPLSDGRLATEPETGAKRLECSYHGWQFEGACGKCTKLPQLDTGKQLLPLYDARAYPVEESQGILYVFLGSSDQLLSAGPPPRVPELDQEGWVYEQDYMRDLPYDYTTLVENIIDPSHVPVSHHGTSQGNRALAQPLVTKVKGGLTVHNGVSKAPPSTVASPDPLPQTALPIGFTGETEVPLHASTRLGFKQQKAKQKVTFTAPSLLSYKFSVAAGDAVALFYPIPVGRGRSRILVRRGRNFLTDRKMTKAALIAKHLENNVVFDQDMAFLRGQEARLQALKADGWGGAWRAQQGAAEGAASGYVMPAEADRFVISFRKQLDGVSGALPWLSPPSKAAPFAAPMPRTELLDRYNQHTKNCKHCTEALALTETCISASKVTAQASVMAALVAIAAKATPSPIFSLLCMVGSAAYSAFVLNAYIVGPVVGALSNKLAATPLALAAVSLLSLILRPTGLITHISCVLLPTLTALSAAMSMRALETLAARFKYTEEAKALQNLPH